MRYPYEQYQANQIRSLAIKAMCAQCAGGPTSDESVAQKQFDSDWKKTIKNCPSLQCPLYAFRPYQDKKTI